MEAPVRLQPMIRDGQIIKFWDGTFGVSVGDYSGGAHEISTIAHFGTIDELLASFPACERIGRIAELARIDSHVANIGRIVLALANHQVGDYGD
jgi:hypothetical protein